MAKLMVGSFGTLAAIVSVNFKVFPRPAEEGTFLATSESLAPLLSLRTAILRSKLQPVAIDLLNPGAATLAGLPDAHYCPGAWKRGGNAALVERHEREWGALAQEHGAADFRTLDRQDAASFWSKVREFPALATSGNSTASVLRISSEPKNLGGMLSTVRSAGTYAVLARASPRPSPT